MTQTRFEKHNDAVGRYLNFIGDDILSQRRHKYQYEDYDNSETLLSIISDASDALDRAYAAYEDGEYKDAEKAAHSIRRALKRLAKEDPFFYDDDYKDRLFDLRVSLQMLDALSP